MRLLLIGISLLLVNFLSQAQTLSTDSTTVDSVKVHSFKKAMLFSAVVPGAGQIYNHIAMPKGKKKAYWKVPLIYAGLGATGYFAFTNAANAKAYRKEVEFRRNNIGLVSNFENFDEAGLLTLYTSARNNRDLLFLGMGFVYLLNIVDAGVEAHFVNFDVSEDLSMAFRPSFNSQYGLGLSLNMNFKYKKQFISSKF
ncbi:MAG: DUF5683 domain-containing protein [Fluviicola sp.]|jgi:hypothetical protein